MTETDALQHIIECRTLSLIAEYRGGKCETRQYRGKDGRPAYMTGVEHRLEVGDAAVQWTEPLPDNADPNKWVAPAARGQRVLVEWEPSPSQQRGLVRIRVRRITPVEAATPATPTRPTTNAPK